MAQHRYTPFYCEENVWWLAQEPRFGGHALEVVLVQNAGGTVLVFNQRAAPLDGGPVVWDYHVVLAAHGGRGVEVWDLDCTRGAPLSAAAWLTASFDPRVPVRFAPRFRLVSADLYVAQFASDRRHMRTANGGWYEPPPDWPIIGGGRHTLSRFVDPGDETLGETIDLDALRRRWR